MSFNEMEISNEGGSPIWLYEFRIATVFWRYTSADRDKTVGLDENGDPAVWLAKAIMHESITQGGGADELEVPFQHDLPLTALFRVNSPSQPLWLTIRRYHETDPDSETPIAWLGTVGNIKDDDEAQARAFCVSLGATFNRNGLRLFWGRNCPHPLYGRRCFVPKEDHAYPTTLASHTGTVITINEDTVAAEGSFTGGFLEWDRGDGIVERRGIEVALSGTDFQVLGLVGAIPVDTDITLYPGCARNTTNCKAFDNLPNYGGFPHMPGKSPFDGTPIF